MNNDVTQQERRAFILKAGSMLGITVCASSLTALLSSCEEDTVKQPTQTTSVTFNVSEVTALSEIGGAVKRTFSSINNGKPVIIIRVADAEYAVFTSVCTHAGCELKEPVKDGNSYTPITCYYADNNCGHGAAFDNKTGVQIEGPGGTDPSGGLTKFQSTYNSTTKILTITV